MPSRRNPHRPLDPELARTIFAERTIRSYQLLTDGACNTNFKVCLDGGSEYVLRLYSLGSPEVERWAMDRVKDAVPVPEMLDWGSDWALMPFLEGEPLWRSPEASEQAGCALAAIAQVTLPRPGRLQANGSIQPYPFGGLEGFVHTYLRKPQVQAWLGDPTLVRIEVLLEREASLCAELDAQHQLVHGDYNPTNILVQNGQVTGILDWEFAHSGSPYADIGNLLRHLGPDCDEPVARALRSNGMRLPPDWRRRAALVDLTSHLEFLTSSLSDTFKTRCMERILHFLDS